MRQKQMDFVAIPRGRDTIYHQNTDQTAGSSLPVVESFTGRYHCWTVKIYVTVTPADNDLHVPWTSYAQVKYNS